MNDKSTNISGDYSDAEGPEDWRKATARRRAEDMAQREVGSAQDWERFIDGVNGEIKLETCKSTLELEGWKFIEAYEYKFDAHTIVYTVWRFHHRLAKKVKKFLPWHRLENGMTKYGAGPLRVPYGLPELLARPTEPIVITEGEKGANRARAAGLLATCVQGQIWTDPEF
jgi:hypothetical protein